LPGQFDEAFTAIQLRSVRVRTRFASMGSLNQPTSPPSLTLSKTAHAKSGGGE
jgi:hypothetical protein